MHILCVSKNWALKFGDNSVKSSPTWNFVSVLYTYDISNKSYVAISQRLKCVAALPCENKTSKIDTNPQ